MINNSYQVFTVSVEITWSKYCNTVDGVWKKTDRITSSQPGGPWRNGVVSASNNKGNISAFRLSA